MLEHADDELGGKVKLDEDGVVDTKGVDPEDAGRRKPTGDRDADYLFAVAEAKVLIEAQEALGTPAKISAKLVLGMLKSTYPWVSGMEARPDGPGIYDFYMSASPKQKVKNDYKIDPDKFWVDDPKGPNRESWKEQMREKYAKMAAEGKFADNLIADMQHLAPYREAIEQMVRNGKLDHFNIVRALRNTPTEKADGMMRYLGRLDEFAGNNVRGVNQVLGDLAAGGNKKEGVDFMLRYMDEKKLWDRTTAFEEVTEDGLRRYDLVTDGMTFEFKSVKTFSPKKFLAQFEQDVADVLTGKIKWVFDGNKMELSRLLQKVE